MDSKWKKLEKLNIRNKKGFRLERQRSADIFCAVWSGEVAVGNINKNRDVMLRPWKENCSNEIKWKLCRTDNEAVNFITL
jgi:hypothetical protein